MLTRINQKKVYGNDAEAKADILEALAGEWGSESQNGLRVFGIGRTKVMQGVFCDKVVAVDIPTAGTRFPAYFCDTHGNSNMVIVEPGSKFVPRPKNIDGGFSFFAVV